MCSFAVLGGTIRQRRRQRPPASKSPDARPRSLCVRGGRVPAEGDWDLDGQWTWVVSSLGPEMVRRKRNLGRLVFIVDSGAGRGNRIWPTSFYRGMRRFLHHWSGWPLFEFVTKRVSRAKPRYLYPLSRATV